MKILIIPEDPTHDGFILQPVVERIFDDLNIKGRIEVLRDPHLKGVEQALHPQMIANIVEDNPMVDLFVLMVDRDCDRFNNSHRARRHQDDHPGKLVACVAIEEAEVWMLALYREELDAPWEDIRRECDPKEKYAEPFLRKKAWRGPGGGRKQAMRKLGSRWRGVLRLCDELQTLNDDVASWWAHRSG